MELTKEYFDQQLKQLATKSELDKLTAFVQKNMVTKEELANLRAELPSRADFSQLQTSVDGIAKQLTVRIPVIVGGDSGTIVGSDSGSSWAPSPDAGG